jgi:hypothetical protein
MLLEISMENELQSANDVIAHLSNKTPRPGRICPLLNHENDTLHIGMSIGMGDFETRPVEQFGSVISDTIKNLYKVGNLVPKGEPRTVYPGSPMFVLLEYLDEKEF